MIVYLAFHFFFLILLDILMYYLIRKKKVSYHNWIHSPAFMWQAKMRVNLFWGSCHQGMMICLALLARLALTLYNCLPWRQVATRTRLLYVINFHKSYTHCLLIIFFLSKWWALSIVLHKQLIFRNTLLWSVFEIMFCLRLSTEA